MSNMDTKRLSVISKWYRLVQPVLFVVLTVAMAMSAYTLYTVWPRLRLLFFSLTNEAEAGCGCGELFAFADNPFMHGITIAVALIAACTVVAWFAVLFFNARRTRSVLEGEQVVRTVPLSIDKRYMVHTLAARNGRVFTIGFFRPAIVVDADVRERLSEEEFQSVLWHEYAHVRSNDPLKKWLLFSFIDMWRWIPGIATLRTAVETAQELLADECALQRTQRHTLLRAFTHLAASTQVDYPASAAFHTGDARLQGLLQQHVVFPYVRRIILLVVSVVVVSTASASVAHGQTMGAQSGQVVSACIHQIQKSEYAGGMSIDTSVQCAPVWQSVEASLSEESQLQSAPLMDFLTK